jgi:hypothetical protein
VGQLGKSEEYWMGRMVCGLDRKFRALNVVAPACVNFGPRRLGPNEQALIMYWCICDLWGPTNLVALMVAELDDTLPRLTDV